MTEYSRVCANGLVHIMIDGHAGDSDVCRSVSTLVNVLFQCLLWFESENLIKIMGSSIGSGRSEIKFEVIDKSELARSRIWTMIITIETGFKMLESTFAENVRCVVESKK